MNNNKQAQLFKGYWVVGTNKWNANIYTQEQAEKCADTLIDCTNCVNCRNCNDCNDCRNCINCRNCSNCSFCRYCINCRDCNDCRNCSECSDCRNCGYCSDCTDCRYCRNCSDCGDCVDCHDCSFCSYCYDCIDCSYCHGFKENPERITSPKIGSRHGHTTYYWTKEHEQIVCGWFRGTLEDFEKEVEEKHRNNQHGIDYKNWIQKVKLYKGNEQ
jgi:hypothetical protein